MKIIFCLLLVLLASPLAKSDQTDYLKIVQEFFIGQASYLNLNISDFSTCFNQSTAEDFIWANFLLPAMVVSWSEGHYKTYQFVEQIVGNATALMNPAMECVSNSPQFDDYLLATFGTTNPQIAVAYYQAFIFIHSQDFIYLASPIMSLADEMDFYTAGRLQASLYQTAAFMVNQVGIYRELYGLIESGAFAAQNLSAPASTIVCYDDVQAELAIQMLTGLSSVVGNSPVDDVWANTVSWFNTNQHEVYELQDAYQCEIKAQEFIQYLFAIGLNTTMGFEGLAEYYVNSNPQEYKNLMLDFGISMLFEDYLGAGQVINTLLNNIAGVSS